MSAQTSGSGVTPADGGQKAGSIQQQLARLEEIIAEIERSASPRAVEAARELTRCLLDLHGLALERMLDLAFGRDESVAGDPTALVRTWANDELVGNVLLLHGLHPDDLETRVRQALEKVRPYLGSHGGGVELLSIEEGRVTLRMEGTCQGCPSSADTIKFAIESAIQSAAPEVQSIAVEGLRRAG